MSAIAKIIPSKLILIHIFQLAWNKVIQGKVHVILMTFFSIPGIIVTIIITGIVIPLLLPSTFGVKS